MKTHPAGSWKNLLFKVCDVMTPRNEVAILSENSCMKKTMIKMTEFPLGVACIETNKKPDWNYYRRRLKKVIYEIQIFRRYNRRSGNDGEFRYISPKADLEMHLKKWKKGFSYIRTLPVVEDSKNC